MAIPLFFIFVDLRRRNNLNQCVLITACLPAMAILLVFHLCNFWKYWVFFTSGDPPQAQQSESLRFYNCLFAGHGDPLVFHVCGASGGATI
jgi:hypothetical protein